MLNRTWLRVLAFAAMVVTGAAATEAQDIVLYSTDVSVVQGNWYAAASSTGAGGQRMTSNDAGWSAPTAPLATPANYFEASFTAPSYTTYHVWLRMRATGDSKWNDSVWVQFSDAADTNGSAAYRIGSTDALLVNLEQCNGCGVSAWGWTDRGYWTAQSPLVMFGARGTHTVRIQTREDGPQIDQIVLSPATYLTQSPGQSRNDVVILPHSTDGGSTTTSSAPAASSSPYLGSAITLPGNVNAQDFDNGGEGVAYHDTSGGNSGGAYRSGDVDLEPSTDGGNDVGWTAAGEWLNYSVNVTAAGNYTVQLRVASPSGGGAMRVNFDKSGVSTAVSVPATGSWQTWTTVSVPVTLSAGGQLLTLAFDTGGFNINRISVVTASASTTSSSPSSPSTSSTPFGGTPWAVPGTIQAEDFDDGPDGAAYHDTTSGNAGGAYRNTGVDIEASSAVGYDVGWTTASEFLNYTVNVASAGSYTVQLRVASAPGGSMHVGFSGSGVWAAVPVAATGGWQSWTTLNVPVTLTAGRQLLTLMVDSGGVNLDKVTIASGTTSSSGSSSGSSNYTSTGSFRMMTWNIQHGTTAYGAYDLASQAQFIASQKPDVVALQEVETWDENQPLRYKQLLEQYTGNSWTVVWAPVTNAASTEGNVILTRLPVSAQNSFQMHATSDYTILYANRSAAQATVKVGSVDVNVFSTHLDYYNTTYRSIQEQQLMTWALNFGGPRLVSGDFNSWWGEYWITNMQTQYTDTWQDYTGSNQNGYTVNNAVRFDYIFRSLDGGWRATPTNAFVPVTSLSDHNPVVADFKVQ
ncbi:MAG TPA: carbohydrate-binding protein [Vicinamibacterales bacterium]|nr:carbohydrate-binding protein [Vicinamibacterales bacterium]